METKLTSFEKEYLENFINSLDKPVITVKYSLLYSSVIILIGLILFISSVIITLNNLNDKIVYWILLPGMLGGILTIFLGIFVSKYFSKYEQNRKIIDIIKKLMN